MNLKLEYWKCFVGESSGPPGSDPIAMMEFYMKKAAQEEKKRQPKQSKDEMPPPPSLQGWNQIPIRTNFHIVFYCGLYYWI